MLLDLEKSWQQEGGEPDTSQRNISAKTVVWKEERGNKYLAILFTGCHTFCYHLSQDPNQLESKGQENTSNAILKVTLLGHTEGQKMDLEEQKENSQHKMRNIFAS